ncbi:MAG: ABC transporter substrate-binding protein [Gammaproteobacteria bacterium]|nr:ABC transporter substrate-binding protein [Gammaproteobacteria bacterium]
MWGKLWTGALLALALAVAPAQAQDPQEAQQLVQQTAEKVLDRLQQDQERLKANPDLIYPLVEDIVLPHFDFARMSQWVLGKHWRAADAGQRERFTNEFRDLLVRTYAKALLEYTDQTIEYLPLLAGDNTDRVVVRTQIVQQGSAYPIPINYNMYHRKDGWKVYDISVDGVSLVSNYRTSFASEIRTGGIDDLIAKLESRNKRGAQGG